MEQFHAVPFCPGFRSSGSSNEGATSHSSTLIPVATREVRFFGQSNLHAEIVFVIVEDKSTENQVDSSIDTDDVPPTTTEQTHDED